MESRPLNNNSQRLNNLMNSNSNSIYPVSNVVDESNNNNSIVNNNNNNSFVDSNQQAIVNVSSGLANLSNQVGEYSANVSEVAEQIRARNQQSQNSLSIIQNEQNRLAVRINESATIEINSIQRSFVLVCATGFLGYLGIRIVNNYVDNRLVISSAHAAAQAVAISAPTVPEVGITQRVRFEVLG